MDNKTRADGEVGAGVDEAEAGERGLRGSEEAAAEDAEALAERGRDEGAQVETDASQEVPFNRGEAEVVTEVERVAMTRRITTCLI